MIIHIWNGASVTEYSSCPLKLVCASSLNYCDCGRRLVLGYEMVEENMVLNLDLGVEEEEYLVPVQFIKVAIFYVFRMMCTNSIT